MGTLHASHKKPLSAIRFEAKSRVADNQQAEVPHPLASVIGEYVDVLHRVSLTLTHDENEAENLTLAAISEALRRSEELTPQTRLKAWLMGVLRETYVSGLHREKEEPDVFIDLLNADAREAVASLPEEFRGTFVLADLEDVPYKEIAHRLDCPMGTVMSRLYRGRRLVRESLQQKGG